MTTQKIYYKKVRDLGGIFSATFGFIKQNFKTLYGSLLFFAGPFLLVSACISGYLLGNNLALSNIFKGGANSFYLDHFIGYLTSMIFVFVGITVYNVILNKNLIENEKLQTQEPLTIHHTIQNFFGDFWRVLGNTLLLVVLMIISIVVIALVFGGLFALSGGAGSGNAGTVIMIVLAVILFFVFFLIFGPVLAFVPMAAIFVCQRDNLPIFAAIKKVLYYMKGNFWTTWMISFVGLMAYSLMAMIVQIPVYIISFITAFSKLKNVDGYTMQDNSTSILIVAVTAICSLLSYGVLVVYHLIINYHYTSLEEKKEGQSIMDKINQIQ
jgi:hypothetical protein